VYLEQVICYGDQHLRDAQKSSLHALLRAEILELRYTELNTAVDCLEALVGAGGAAIQEDII
jgi:hypothetical protein